MSQEPLQQTPACQSDHDRSTWTKHQWRQWAKIQRQQLVEQGRLPFISQALVEILAQGPLFESTERVVVFSPMHGEVDITPLRDIWPDKTWYLPKMMTETEMGIALWSSDTQLIPHPRWGMLEPSGPIIVSPPWSAQTLVLTPALAVDEQGFRLGYGKGIFDRWLATVPSQVVTVCPVPDELKVKQLPRDSHDWPVNWVMTPSGATSVEY